MGRSGFPYGTYVICFTDKRKVSRTKFSCVDRCRIYGRIHVTDDGISNRKGCCYLGLLFRKI